MKNMIFLVTTMLALTCGHVLAALPSGVKASVTGGSSDDERIVYEASDAVVSLSNDPATLARLHSAAGLSPAVAAYADIRAVNRIDTALVYETAAACALVDVAKDMPPSVRARTLYNMANVYGSMADKRCLGAIDEAVSCARADTSTGAETRLVLYELTRLYLLRNHFEGDNPMRFAEIFTLEKRALAVYSTMPDSRDKAEVYQMLAQMKGYTDFSDDFIQATDRILFSDPATDRSIYDFYVDTGVSTNSMYYYRESLDIYRRVLGSDNADVTVPWINYLLYCAGTADGSSLVASADSVVSLAEANFPEGHPYLCDIKAIRDYIAAASGYPMRFAWKYKDFLATYRSFYGRYGSGYVQALFQLSANFAAAAGSEALPKEFYDLDREYTSVAKKVYADDMGQYASDLLLYLNAYEPRDAAAFNDKLSLLTDIVNTTVSAPSWKMFGAGVYLANYKFANDRSQEAIDMLRTMINSAKVLTGDRTMPFVANMALSMAMFAERARSGVDNVKRIYSDAITAYSEAGMQKHTPVLCYAQYLFGLGDYAEVSRLLSGLLSDPALKANRTDEAFVRLFLGFSMIAGSSADGSVKDADSVHKLFSEAIPVFMSDDVAVTPITVEGYRYISGYYRFFGNVDLSGQALERGWQVADSICAPMDLVYLDFFNELFSYYFSNGRDREAELLNEKYLAKFKSLGLENSGQYIEALWNRFLIANWRSPNDILSLYKPLIEQSESIMSLYERSGRSQNVLYSYMLRIMCAMVNVASRGVEYLKFPESQIPEYYRAGYDYTKRMYELMDNQLIPLMEQMEQGFPEYSKPYDYRLQPDYFSLIEALLSWYQYIRPDPAKAEHYIRLVYDVENYNDEPWRADFSMAQYYNGQKDYAKAYYYNTRCYGELGQFTMFDKFRIGSMQSWLATLQEDYDKAADVALAHGRRIKDYVLGNFDFISSNERAEFINFYGMTGSSISNVLGRRPERLSAPAYDAALFDKGLLLHSWERLRRSILRSGDKSLIASLDTLDVIRKRISSTDINPADSVLSMQMANLRADVDRLEKNLARRTAQFRTDTMRVVTWREVQARLKEGEAAIEFTFADSAIAALVLRPGYDMPRYVRLCKAKECYDMLAEVEDFPAMTRVKRLYSYGRSRLYELLWRPLESCLEGVKTVYYSPTAFLHRVSFDAIPITAGIRLTDRYDLRYVSTTAQLLRHGQRKVVGSAAVFGGIYYSPEQEPLPGDGRERSARAAVTDVFPYLEQTKVETDTISGLVERNGLNLERYVGAKGTEPNFYSLDGRSPDIIHLATHGFYIKEKDVAANAFLANHPGDRYSSMQRTGITFCGANATWLGERRADRNDGVMTAAELSLLDLGRTDLVVLSACETALGDYSIEGVYGLQRGFKEAGVNTLIMSLWNVNDLAASEFMQDFYRRWLGGQSKHEAFREAMASMRAVRPDPFFWAAFVLLDAN